MDPYASQKLKAEGELQHLSREEGLPRAGVRACLPQEVHRRLAQKDSSLCPLPLKGAGYSQNLLRKVLLLISDKHIAGQPGELEQK